MERNNTLLAGGYFVAAELYRRGFSVGMTIGNVKAIRNKKSVGWPITKDKVLDDVMYVFVNLNDQSNQTTILQ
jgi:hypothetical protein